MAETAFLTHPRTNPPLADLDRILCFCFEKNKKGKEIGIEKNSFCHGKGHCIKWKHLVYEMQSNTVTK